MTHLQPLANSELSLTLERFFSETPIFPRILSTSNLYQPDQEAFFRYMKHSFDAHHITNNGPVTQMLEERLTEIHGVKHCITTCNGFWAIGLAIMALAIKGRSEVLLPSFTYRRMADILAWCGLTPHFCDIDESTLALSYETVRQQINENTALILAAHPIVTHCDIEGMINLSQEYDLPLLFDSVEAAYSSHNGLMLGGFGNAECYSVHASKFLNGFEGGYITTNDDVLAAKLQKMRTFGFRKQEDIACFGINAKLNDIHAAMALACIDEVETQIRNNKNRYSIYRKGIKSIPGLQLLEYSDGQKNVRTYKNIIVKFTGAFPFSREETLAIMHKENLLARNYYAPPLHQKSATYNRITPTLLVTDRVAMEYMLLPSSAFMLEEDTHNVIAFLEFLVANHRRIREELYA